MSTKTGATFAGVYWEADSQALVLKDASEADPHSEAKWVKADGELVILIADVAYFQFLV